jgi:hypothetical protein
MYWPCFSRCQRVQTHPKSCVYADCSPLWRERHHVRRPEPLPNGHPLPPRRCTSVCIMMSWSADIHHTVVVCVGGNRIAKLTALATTLASFTVSSAQTDTVATLTVRRTMRAKPRSLSKVRSGRGGDEEFVTLALCFSICSLQALLPTPSCC